MMTQYLAIKEDHPDCLLFYRMGDFYELFFEDAVAAAGALDITLTKRGKHRGRDIPMCGVPVHSHASYLSRLIRRGFKVAVCEQTENPADARKRGPKSLVRRDVIRVITAGTLTEDSLLETGCHNYLAACAEAGGALGLAWIDMSTGVFRTQPIAESGLAAGLARLSPGELLVADGLLERPLLSETWSDWSERLTRQPASRFDSRNGRRRLETLFGVRTLDAFGAFTRPELAAAGALVDYIELTQKGRLPRLEHPERLSEGAVMEIDAATRRNLELVRSLSGERRGSLLSVIDRTVTGAGARLLAERLATPLTDPAAIEPRLDAVQSFVDGERQREDLRRLLRRSPDMERALSRLTLGRSGPRDLAAIRDGLARAADVRRAMTGTDPYPGPTEIEDCLRGLGEHGEIVERLTRALEPELPLHARDGGYIAKGYSRRLDELVVLRDESRRLTVNLQDRYARETGIQSLKVRHNNVLGYFVEVPSRQADRIPLDGSSPFIHRQTLASAVRFATVELGDLEGRIAKAADQALALEISLFEDLVAEVTARSEAVAEAARSLARLDVAAALAELAVEARYRRPQVDDSLQFVVAGGRHPVVEAALRDAEGAAFVANDCRLSGDGHEDAPRLCLLTGPNMAGKSTYLRQNALIAILAQMGSFVPADRARIGVIDRLFSRVGAADDLARGRSTFMVEMVETAAILNQAGPRGLVILDEIGRGTATFDGLSIAWAVVEHLHETNRCRALFATHYHELTRLASRLAGLQCFTMRVKEWQGDVVFLHEVAAGAADRSYGIHVGQLAGLPAAVVERAEQVLKTLEQGEDTSAIARLADDLPLFSAAVSRERLTRKGPSPLEDAVGRIHADELSPRTALELVYRLKELMEGGE